MYPYDCGVSSILKILYFFTTHGASSSSPSISGETLKRHISSRTDPNVARFVTEAESCINVITCDDNDDEEEMGSVPFTASLAADERFGLSSWRSTAMWRERGGVCGCRRRHISS
ncbi:hypothetical protein QJS10_CPA10g00935 [Acorus calamus]|uniref:Uncharacterized protein n=1 Tax=Acorus calamus TaxID=4465 RepID=A0AAV9E1H5_ACOCL|nr:hypothetical protein QJS10_CPA10g00935 [Acorus calamus]